MEIKLRRGLSSDIPATLELVKELAHFERCPGEVEVSVAEMENWGFGKDPIFSFFVLEKNNKIVGMALYYFKYSTWKGKCMFLEDIIVTESERKQGFGKMLFDEILRTAKELKVRRLEWQVLDWNVDAIAFYRKYASGFDNTWINCKLTYGQLQSLKI